MRQVKVDVTADDISRGERNNTFNCPIAMALKRLGVEHPIVNRGYWFDSWAVLYPSRLPVEARRFIEAFDQGRPVEPFSFYTDM